jgi:tyrosyl-tRNA synthetase
MTASPDQPSLGNIHDVLHARGFIAQATDEDARTRLMTPTTAYAGFDPTADSLHVGSLVPIMGLYWLQQCGHRPLVVVGGATALVGDPSGKTAMRKMLTRAEIGANVVGISAQIGRLVRFGDDATGGVLLNNADWLAGMNWIDLLREVGPHFSVNRMLALDSVKNRIEGGGISFLEFNYMIMQAYDFLHLHRVYGCSLQMGGQDQWGNIVMGIELVRRVAAAAADGAEPAKSAVHGLTFPLVTKSDGGKFGKSEKGNIWLSAERTPVYEFYQFWRNVADADVRKFLGFFTTLPMAEVESLASAPGAGINHAKEVLAFEVTRLIHGAEAAEQARADARKAFGAAQDTSGDSIPHGALDAAELAGGIGLLGLLVRAKLADSNSAARRLVQQGAVKVHDQAVTDIAYVVGSGDNQGGKVLLRAGKKNLFRFDIA